jgi:glycosyltransferase involved in cell wall biosynthesis
MAATVPSDRPLNILHVFRAPLGGLFRHVADLVAGQAKRGHRVGIIADRTEHGPLPEGILAKLKDQCALGLTRISIPRELGPADISGTRHVASRIREANADVVHGHGAKGGAYARLAAPGHPAIRAYTMHGGSLLYRPGSLASWFYITLERVLLSRTDLFLFESTFIGELYRQRVGEPTGMTRVVVNGVSEKEFDVVHPRENASDIVFVGELRPIKGIDVLIDAIADIRKAGIPVTATIVGSGASRNDLERQVRNAGLIEAVKFSAPLPAREAFTLGRLAVVPSRGESMPYIVIELAAAQVPMVATNVGGIPDIFGPQSGRLLPPGDRPALVQAITRAINDPETIRQQSAELREHIRTDFSLDQMVDGVLAAYRDALQARHNASE